MSIYDTLTKDICIGLSAILLNGCAYLTVTNKGYIGRDVIRTRQPSVSQLERLVADEGVRTILNLRGENPKDRWYQDETEFSSRNGIGLVSIGLSCWSFPSRDIMYELVEFFENAQYPVLIHCKAGADRTGFVSALYRHLILDEPIAEAKKSMAIRHGHLRYMPLDFLLDQYEKEDGKDFRRWLDDSYDPARLKRMYELR